MKQTIAVTLAVLALLFSAAAKAQEQWKLIWYNHYSPNMLFEVFPQNSERLFLRVQVASYGECSGTLFRTHLVDVPSLDR
jgi:hypothetical protein